MNDNDSFISLMKFDYCNVNGNNMFSNNRKFITINIYKNPAHI